VTARRRIAALTRLELADALRSRWLAFTAVIYTLVFGAFVWLGLRESAVLGFTGLSRAVLHVANATVVAVPLVALVASCQSVARARASGHLELILAQPVRRGEWFTALVLSRLAVLLGPLALILGAAAVAGAVTAPADAALGALTVHALLVAGSLVWAYLGLGLVVSAWSPTLERAVVMALVVWLTSAALHDFALIGVLLQWRVPPGVVFGLAAANPVEAARLAVLAGVDPELSVLGPVGFWIANQLGPTATYAFGLGWPALVGTAAVALAHRRVVRGDAIG